MSVQSESAIELAAEIVSLHSVAEKAVDKSKKAIDAGIQARLQCAVMVETARSEMGTVAFWDFWREQVQLGKDVARQYLTLHKTRDRKTDKRQMQLAGVLETTKAEKPAQRKTVDLFAWSAHVDPILDALTPERLAAMTDDQRAIVKSTLEPIADIYDAI